MSKKSMDNRRYLVLDLVEALGVLVGRVGVDADGEVRRAHYVAPEALDLRQTSVKTM